MMAISEQTRINLGVGTLVSLAGMVAIAAVRIFVDESAIARDHRAILIIRDRVDALANPDKPWAIDYWQHSHEHDYE